MLGGELCSLEASTCTCTVAGLSVVGGRVATARRAERMQYDWFYCSSPSVVTLLCLPLVWGPGLEKELVCEQFGS